MIPYGVGSNQFHNYYPVSTHHPSYDQINLMDYGPNPFSINFQAATLQNENFRTALWTGTYFQLTLMSLNPGEDIGLERHPDVDQYLRIEQGQGLVMMGPNKENMPFKKMVSVNDIIIIPAGTWHNLINTGNVPLKLNSIYAPVQHPFGTVHKTKEDAKKE